MEFAERCTALVWVFPLLLNSCAVGTHHTTDLKLEQNFAAHEAEFEKLLAETKADAGLEMLRDNELRYSGQAFNGQIDIPRLETLGLTNERLAMYRQQARNLGIVQLTKSRGTVEFRVDDGTFSNGDSYKGYEYSPVPPTGNQKTSLDGYRISKADRDPYGDFFVYKPIKGNWYLYLFVSGG